MGEMNVLWGMEEDNVEEGSEVQTSELTQAAAEPSLVSTPLHPYD
jgi:hypothetical protein